MQKQSNEDIINEFKKRRRRQYIIIIVVTVVFLYMKWDKFKFFIRNIIPINGFVLILILALCLLFSLFNWRCPACNAYLGRNILLKYCGKCGSKLR